MPQPDWLYVDDAEQYTYNRWNDVVASVTSGAPFVSANIPEGHVHREWTVKEAMLQETQIAVHT